MSRSLSAIVPRHWFQGPLWPAAGLLALTPLLVIFGTAPLAAAPDDEEVRQVEEQQELGQRVAGRVDWIAQFDTIIFSPAGSLTEARACVDARLNAQLDEIDRACEPTAAQRRKLLLAAEGDAKRFFYQVSELRRKCEAMEPEEDANNFAEMWQLMNPLQTKYQGGIFGPTSLFSKAIRQTLTPEQMAAYRATLDGRRRFRNQAQALAVMLELEKSLPLEDSQHEALLKLLLEHIQAHEQESQEADPSPQLHWFAALPPEKVRPILDQRQAEQFKRICEQAGGNGMRLIRQNVIVGQAAEAADEE